MPPYQYMKCNPPPPHCPSLMFTWWSRPLHKRCRWRPGSARSIHNPAHHPDPCASAVRKGHAPKEG